ncbi:hypothetical protein [Pseudoalteromonas prydzensis]|uniref:hypothetical protein n=1 Tax=Pseudoalteromonas prydzensis TaxID=182141 RepID=UPI0024BC2106|nr:hypothetical protein [Pseudoalteromonas prydzensis]
MKKHFIGSVLFTVAIILIVSTEAYLAITFKDFILEGKGIGIYGVFLYFIVLILCSLLWLFSYLISKSRVKAFIFWILALVLLPVIVFQPTWWAAPLLS